MEQEVMLEERLIDVTDEKSEQPAGQPTLSADEALSLVRQLVDRGMLRIGPAAAERWDPEVRVDQFADVLYQHLSKSGWRRILEAMRWHNRHKDGADWDLNRPADLLLAAKLAVSQVEQLREKIGDQLQIFCDEHNLPVPRPHSQEEAYSLHLLNAYLVALAEAEGAIAKRGAALAKRHIQLEGERAEARLESRILPDLLETCSAVNPLRESWFRERVRHKFALLVGGLFGALWGAAWGVVESVNDLLIRALARHATVTAPALLIALLTLFAQTVAYRGPFTLDVVPLFVLRAFWNGALALGAATLTYGCWLYYAAHRGQKDSETPDDHLQQFLVSSDGAGLVDRPN